MSGCYVYYRCNIETFIYLRNIHAVFREIQELRRSLSPTAHVRPGVAGTPAKDLKAILDKEKAIRKRVVCENDKKHCCQWTCQ